MADTALTIDFEGGLSLTPGAEQMNAEMDADLCAAVRQKAKFVTGGNCAFAIDDVGVLERLALNAAKAGLVDGLHPAVAAKTLKIANARREAEARHDAKGGSNAPL